MISNSQPPTQCNQVQSIINSLVNGPANLNVGGHVIKHVAKGCDKGSCFQNWVQMLGAFNNIANCMCPVGSYRKVCQVVQNIPGYKDKYTPHNYIGACFVFRRTKESPN